jgi:hypothetical protein
MWAERKVGTGQSVITTDLFGFSSPDIVMTVPSCERVCYFMPNRILHIFRGMNIDMMRIQDDHFILI